MSKNFAAHELNRRELIRLSILASALMTPIGKAWSATTAEFRVMLGRPTHH
jgi:hypothetical protein